MSALFEMEPNVIFMYSIIFADVVFVDLSTNLCRFLTIFFLYQLALSLIASSSQTLRTNFLGAILLPSFLDSKWRLLHLVAIWPLLPPPDTLPKCVRPLNYMTHNGYSLALNVRIGFIWQYLVRNSNFAREYFIYRKSCTGRKRTCCTCGLGLEYGICWVERWALVSYN